VSFILAKQRDQDVVAAFERYRNYVQSIRDRFPRAAFEPASSDWYFNPQDRRCPHDAWLENIAIGEPSEGQRSGFVASLSVSAFWAHITTASLSCITHKFFATALTAST
jgi:hypothetical protein